MGVGSVFSAGALDSEADGVGSGLSSEPESDEEPEPGVSEPDGSEALGSFSSSAGALVEAEGDGVGDASSLASSVSSSNASTQSLYSSIVRFFADGLSSARASVGVKPIPMRMAVGIDAMAIALPAGTCNLVNNGFLGAACRGPVLSRDSPAGPAYWTSSAGTVPPVRPVGRARS